VKLWLLRPIDEVSGPWKPWYDKAFGFVIRAETEMTARERTIGMTGDEARQHKSNPWLDPKLTSCIELSTDGACEVIIRDFQAA
jgi:hypothetical protein